MPRLKRTLYERADGPDEDRWRLVLDTDARLLFVEHEEKRGDLQGAGYGIAVDDMDITTFLNEYGRGQSELIELLSSLFGDRLRPEDETASSR
jgi:hypothetical protein